MTTQNTLSKEQWLERAVDCVNETDGQKADLLYSSLVSDLRAAYGENEKQIAADLQMLAKELEAKGLIDQAFQFKQRTCEVMLKLSMEARMRSRVRAAETAPQPPQPAQRARPDVETSQSSKQPATRRDATSQAVHLPVGSMLIEKLASVSTGAESNWYERFFKGHAIDFWVAAFPDELTRREVEMLKKHLDVSPPQRLLDIPCGNGRHAKMLAQEGFKLTGVDLSEEFIHRAKAAGGRADDENPRYSLCDMAEYSRVNEFDGAYCLGNSFGYLPHDRELRFLNNVCAGLKAGARFVVDVSTAAECLLPHLRHRDWLEAGGVQVLISNSYDALHSVLVTDYTFKTDGKDAGGLSETRRALIHVYTLAEIHRMFSHCGFEVIDLFDGIESDRFQYPSRQAFIVAKKID